MQLLVVRHAIAAERTDWAGTGREDSRRPLTDKGRSRMRLNAAGIAAITPRLDIIATSPFTRAAETARVLARAWRGVPIETVAALASGGSRKELLAWLVARDPEDTVALVGHEPDLGALVAALVAGEGAQSLAMRKGGACLVRFVGLPRIGRGELRWFLPPRLLRRLAP
ncbi:MAG: histidine phosphatase family protein [Candidatus Binatia bacterium]